MKRDTTTRRHNDVDPILSVAIAQLVQAHGREAVLAAAKAVGRRSAVPEASRVERETLAGLIDGLRGVMEKSSVFAFLTRQRTAGVPVAISIEILERVRDTRAVNAWALITRIMADDYPHYEWRR
jgi:hypothetical protein